MKTTKQIYDELYASGYPAGDVATIANYIKSMYPQLQHSNEASILDVGCGLGTLRQHFQYSSYVGIDISMEAIKRAFNNKRPNDLFVCADFLTYDLPKMDIVVCSDVLEHLKSADALNLITKLLEATSNILALSICCRDSYYRDSNGDSLHLTIQDPAYWISNIILLTVSKLQSFSFITHSDNVLIIMEPK